MHAKHVDVNLKFTGEQRNPYKENIRRPRLRGPRATVLSKRGAEIRSIFNRERYNLDSILAEACSNKKRISTINGNSKESRHFL